jgi:hypothetical protein
VPGEDFLFDPIKRDEEWGIAWIFDASCPENLAESLRAEQPAGILNISNSMLFSILVLMISKHDLEQLRKYPSVKQWLQGKSERTQYNYLRVLARVTRQVEDTPDWLVRSVKKAKLEDRRDFVGAFSTKDKNIIRSFLLTNGCSLES